MPPLTFDELQNGLTSDVIFDGMIADLRPDFPVDDWNDGAIPKTLLEAWSLALSRGYKSVSAINASGFLKLAPDSWISLIARYVYGVIPFPASYTTGKLKFTVAPGVGPYSIRGGGSTATTADSALRFFTNNPLPISITSALPVWIPIIAESPGVAYNLLQGQIIKLATALPGVTVTNVPEPPDASWIMTYGADAETFEQIRQRCAARFGRLSVLQNYPTDGYVSLVRDRVPQVKKVSVYTNFFQGTARPGCATLFLAGDSGPVTSAVVDQTLAAIRPYRNPLGTIFAASCLSVDLIIGGIVEVLPDFNFAVVSAAIAAQLADYQRSAQIGEKIFSAAVIERVMLPQGVKNFRPVGLTDVQLGTNQVVNFIPQLQFVT
jgi:hypothetical protein